MGTAILLFTSVALLPVLVKVVSDLLVHIAEKREAQGKFKPHPDLQTHIRTNIVGPRV